MSNLWSASDARSHFAQLLDNAAEGHVQNIERRDGAEFVLLSKKLFLASRPSLAGHLAQLDTGLAAQDASIWLETMRDAQGKDRSA